MIRRLRDPWSVLPDLGRHPTAKPDVGLVGFYGAGNYGDELFLEVFRSLLRAPLRLHPLLDLRPGRARHVPVSRVRRMDAIVIGGGDLVVPWRRGSYWQRTFLERPVFIAGVGVPRNSLKKTSPAAVAQLREFFQGSNVRGISARDPESVAWIEQELQPSVSVQEIPDLVCALDLPPVDRPSGPPIFGVAVRNRKQADDLTHVQQMCRRAVELGYRLRRIVLATGPLRSSDMETTQRLGFADTELVATDDLDDISRAIGECSVFASMKFHGVVVATMYRVPSIVLMPSAKTTRFASRIGRTDGISSFNDPVLPDLVPSDPVPLPAALPAELRAPARDYLEELKLRILEVASNGYP